MRHSWKSWNLPLAFELLLVAMLLVQTGCGASPDASARPDAAHPSAATETKTQAPLFSAQIVKTYPHDRHAFTQGLEFSGGHLYESTGRLGQSTLRQVALETGEAKRKVDLPAKEFGEGLTIFHGKIYQLTWLSKTGFIYDPKSLRKTGEFHYDWEGWGLAHDDASLIASDGTNMLRFLDPASFQVTRTLEVYGDGEAVANLNELEYIDGQIFANIWHSRRIARIDPRSGQVVAWIDLEAIAAKEEHSSEDVLNGIAYDPATHGIFVTGKNWSKLFEIKLDISTAPK